MRVALNRPATLTVTVRNYDGTAVAPTAAPSVSVTDIDNVEVAAGTATAVVGSTGVYTYNLPAVDVLDTLGAYAVTFEWAVAGKNDQLIIPVEVVNNHLFEIHEIRAWDNAFSDAVRYTADEIREARDRGSDRLEKGAQVAFTSRQTRETLSGDGSTTLMLPNSLVTEIVGVIVDDYEFTEEDIDQLILDPEGVITNYAGWTYGTRNIVVDYVHGYPTTPAEVKTAAMIVAKDHLVPSATPGRATSQSTDLGEFRISVANLDAGRPTGIPEVDTVIALYGRRRPSVR